MLLPTYNALHDPFLAGFFDHPSLKKHLRRTGAVKRKRNLSVKMDGFGYTEENFPLPGRPTTNHTQRKGKSLSKSTRQQEVRLPSLEAYDRPEALSASTSTRHKRAYVSARNDPPISH